MYIDHVTLILYDCSACEIIIFFNEGIRLISDNRDKHLSFFYRETEVTRKIKLNNMFNDDSYIIQILSQATCNRRLML